MRYIIFIAFLLSATIHSQENKYERIKALKTAYITEQLSLTPSEAEKFWPVYNSYDEKHHDLRHRKHEEIYKKLNSGIENLTDEDANMLLDEYLLIETNQLELNKQKTFALRKVLTPKKIVRLKKAEDDFKRELLDRYRKGKEKSVDKGGKH